MFRIERTVHQDGTATWGLTIPNVCNAAYIIVQLDREDLRELRVVSEAALLDDTGRAIEEHHDAINAHAAKYEETENIIVDAEDDWKRMEVPK